MFAQFAISDQKGFTLIEIISVLVIMGVMGSVVVKKFDVLSGTATARALQVGVEELNVRETLVWTNMKFSYTGWTSDADVFTEMETNLGGDYVWTDGPDGSGGELSFGSTSVTLSRTPSTVSSIGSWK
jgi:prepilin-type N-terminal cleavage/methylation domain-containing protein